MGPRAMLLAGWLATVAVVALTPTTPWPDPSPSFLRFVCGRQGTADALLNVAFFVPLGMLFGRGRRASLLAAATGFGLSLGIEATQLALPGRNPCLGDTIWNGVGAGLGAVLLGATAPLWTRGGRPPARLPAYLALALGAAFAFAGWLLEPLPPEGPYWGMWTPVLGSMVPYRGEVIDARLNGRAIPDGEAFPDGWEARGDLLGDWTLEVELAEGPPPSSLSPLVNVPNLAGREAFLLGVDGHDLVWRERMRAAALRFDQPEHRVPNAFSGYEEGDTVRVVLTRLGDSRCVHVGGRSVCDLNPTPGRTWALLLDLPAAREGFRRALDSLWMLLLFGCLGWASASRRQVAASGAVLAALVVAATILTPLSAFTALEAAGGLAGLALGWSAGQRVRRGGANR